MKKILKHIWKHVVKWNEYITIPIAILLWYFSPVFLHWIDPTAATYDSGIFQIILFSTIQLLFYNGIVWLVLKWTWPGIYNFLDTILEEKILGNGSITQWEKCKLVIMIFAIYFIGIILLSRVI